MKKIASLLLGLVMLTSTTFGQAKQETKKSEKVTTSAPKMKKDGTLDKRFKEHKGSTQSPHLKKDGTPDKRYKKKG